MRLPRFLRKLAMTFFLYEIAEPVPSEAKESSLLFAMTFFEVNQ